MTIALACASLAATAVGAGPATAGSADAGSSERWAAVTGFNGPRGFDIGVSGKTVIADSDGAVTRVFRTGAKAGTRKQIAHVSPGFGAAVAVADDDAVWILTGGGEGPDSGSLFLKKPGKNKRLVADISAWVAANNLDPFDLEGVPEDSNPYNVASMSDGSAVVADAANNSIMRVERDGTVEHIARVKTRVVEMPAGYEDVELPPGEDPLPPPGTPMPSEAVVTAVTVGADGAYYLGELRGFPGTPGTSEIWRVKPGATDAVCRPNNPDKGKCRRVADGLTSIISLDTGLGGSIYAAELSKQSWLAMEFQKPGSEVGAVIKIGHHPQFRSELSPGEVILPGAVALGPSGAVFVSGPIFGPGGFKRIG